MRSTSKIRQFDFGGSGPPQPQPSGESSSLDSPNASVASTTPVRLDDPLVTLLRPFYHPSLILLSPFYDPPEHPPANPREHWPRLPPTKTGPRGQ
jgi:hypothetical protein